VERLCRVSAVFTIHGRCQIVIVSSKPVNDIVKQQNLLDNITNIDLLKSIVALGTASASLKEAVNARIDEFLVSAVVLQAAKNLISQYTNAGVTDYAALAKAVAKFGDPKLLLAVWCALKGSDRNTSLFLNAINSVKILDDLLALGLSSATLSDAVKARINTIYANIAANLINNFTPKRDKLPAVSSGLKR